MPRQAKIVSKKDMEMEILSLKPTVHELDARIQILEAFYNNIECITTDTDKN